MNPIEVQKIRRENLRRFIQERFDGSVNAFAKYITRPASFFYDALSGKRPLGEKIMRYIEDTFNLIRYELDRTDDGSFEHRRFELIKVFSPDMVNAKLDGIIAVSDTVDVLPVSLDMINRLSWEINDLMWINVHDLSMAPTLNVGTKVLVYQHYKELFDNKIYVVRKDKNIFVRRIFLDDFSNSIVFHADNVSYPRFVLSKDRLDEIEIIGRALAKSAEDL